MKIGYVLKRFPRFSETFILNEVLELERQGVEVEIFSLMHPPKEPRHEFLNSLKAPIFYLPRAGVVDRCSVYSGKAGVSPKKQHLTQVFEESSGAPFSELFPGKKSANAAHICLQATALAMIASARGIQHFHAHFASNATTVSLLAGRLSNISYSFTAHAKDIYHTYVNQEVDNDLRRQKIEEARFLVTVSEYNRKHLLTIANESSRQKVFRLYNGIDLNRFVPSSDKREDRLFLTVGRLVEKKGFQYLVEACRQLKAQGVAFRCLIVGDGPDEAQLAGRIREWGLEDCVVLAGAQTQNQLIQTMRTASAMVLPSVICSSGDRDGLPTVLLESMGMGLPVISTTVAGIPEIIDHEKTGLLIPPNDSQSLAAAIAQILDKPIQAQSMGAAGRVKAEQRFDLAKNVADLRQYFNCAVSVDSDFNGKGTWTENRMNYCR